MQAKQLFLDVAPDYNARFDPWGSAMGTYFDVATEAWMRGIAVPSFYPGAGIPTIENEYSREVLANMSDDDVVKLVRFCHKLTYILEKAGRAY